MNRTKKEEVVAAVTERMSNAEGIYLADFTGLSVKKMTDLRQRFRAQGADFVVVKNTLATRAFEQAKIEGLNAVLAGPTGFVFASGDPAATAKVIRDFQKEQDDKPVVKAGFVEGRTVGPEDVARLAALPTRDELMGQVAGAMQAPLAGFVGALGGVLYQFAGVMESLRAQRDEAA